ncbi:MAG: HDIG domain-containing protein [Candidatus Bathyarchaeota archaeon]|nr:HDIG domain-containing protein [Candidatus Bathyarchaeota archaeon]
MSSKVPSREQALKVLQENHCSKKVIAHCKAVSELAVETAQVCRKKGVNIDVELVEIGALLHDLGRGKTHSVNHVVEGAELARKQGLPEQIIEIIERHMGGGITPAEAKKLCWPEGNYMPTTIEQKIVSYADKLIENGKRAPIEVTINKLREEQLDAAADRVQMIHDEIAALVEES